VRGRAVNSSLAQKVATLILGLWQLDDDLSKICDMC
jgi:hypothetical protein